MHFVSLYKNKNEISEIVPFIKYLPGEDLEILSRKDYVGIGCLIMQSSFPSKRKKTALI